MEKRKTLLMVMLCLVLAALIVAAAVLGVSLSRSSFSDADTGEAGEARWRMTCEITTADGGLRPSYEPYEGEARSRRCFVPVGTLRNEGDLKATLSLDASTDDAVLEPVTDRDTGYADDMLFSDEEITEHFRVLVMYWSYAEGLASADDGAVMFSGQEGGDGQDPVMVPCSDGGDDIYVYADITWTTDLEEDMDDWYDGSFGDEFDEWAGRHLLGLIINVDLKAAQAE